MKDFKFQTNSTAIIFYSYENSADKKNMQSDSVKSYDNFMYIYIENNFVLEVRSILILKFAGKRHSKFLT